MISDKDFVHGYFKLIDESEQKKIAKEYVLEYIKIADDITGEGLIDGKKYAKCITLLLDYKKSELGQTYLDAIISSTLLKLSDFVMQAKLPNDELVTHAIIIITDTYLITSPLNQISFEHIFYNIKFCQDKTKSFVDKRYLKEEIKTLKEDTENIYVFRKAMNIKREKLHKKRSKK